MKTIAKPLEVGRYNDVSMIKRNFDYRCLIFGVDVNIDTSIPNIDSCYKFFTFSKSSRQKRKYRVFFINSINLIEFICLVFVRVVYYCGGGESDKVTMDKR